MRSIVSITYDDGLESQRTLALPALQSWELPATFFVPIRTCNHLAWKDIPAAYEIGNHTCAHPTPRALGLNPPWLENFTARSLELDLLEAQAKLTDPRPAPISFAYPCYATRAVRPDRRPMEIEDIVRKLRLYGRAGELGTATPIEQIRLTAVPALGVAETSVRTVLAAIKEAERVKGTWLVLVFHGVGPRDYLTVSEEDHNRILQAIHEARDRGISAPYSADRAGVDVLTFGEAATRIDAARTIKARTKRGR